MTLPKDDDDDDDDKLIFVPVNNLKQGELKMRNTIIKK
jgi:hypothetical protein